MSGPVIDEFDPVWLLEKTRPVARDWCPQCEPGVDPVRECVVPYFCADHRSDPTGADDARVSRAYVAPVVEGLAWAEGGWP